MKWAVAIVALAALVFPPAVIRQHCYGFPTWEYTWLDRGHLRHTNFHGQYLFYHCE